MTEGLTGRSATLQESEVSLRDLLDVAHRRRWIILIPFLAILGGAIGLSLATPPVYRASATVTIDKALPVVLLDKAGELSLFAGQAAAQAPDVFTLAELIKSEVVREGAIARLTPAMGEQTAKAVLAGLSVQQVRDTELVRIHVEHTDAKVAATAANAVAESLVDMNLKARRRRATETREFIDKQLAVAGQKLRSSEAKLVAFKEQHGDVSLAEETTLALQKLAELEAKRVELRLPREEAQALIATLQNQLATLAIELSGLERQFTSKHPSVISTEAKIAETKRRLQAEMARIRQTEQSRERALTATIGQYEERMRHVPARQADLTRLTRNTKEAEEIYLLLSTKFQQALIDEASIGSAVQIVDAAKVPDAPAKARARRTILLGAIFGLMLGTGAALLIEHLDETVKSADEVERVLGAPVLGAIPVEPRRDGHLAPLDRSPTATEAYRALRTHILSAIPDARHKCLLVTSPLPGEGKTTVAANLALALARTGRLVWLLDCDLRHPGSDGLFPEAASLGMAAFLTGRAQIDEVVRPTEEAHCWFIASGPALPDAAEQLGNQRMGRLIGEARARADIALLDTPAILSAADAEVIAGYADGAILVVKAAKTDRRALAQARQLLERMGVRVVGAVLNFVPPGQRNGYYHSSS